jgi:transposase
MDVHAKTLVVCLWCKGKKEVRTYATTTRDLLTRSDWLVSRGCTHAAIESMGVYCKPVFNVLDGVVELVVANARHIKAVPGRKTDVRDCEWICDVLRHGLLKGSFIPPRPIRELRELTRHRQTLVKQRSALANRAQKIVESGNIKLAQVASNALGVSGRAMLRALADGEQDASKMAQLARGQLKAKREQLERALGESADPFASDAVRLLTTIPGEGDLVAQTIVSEVGTDMGQFPSAGHLASWAGVCPGNNESAGKRKSGTTTKGSPNLRVALVQAAWSASHTTNTYVSAQYGRLAKRLGKKKALLAVGHTILVIAYHVLKERTGYRQLGGDYFDRQATDRQKARLIRKLEALGLSVSVSPKDVPA